MSSSRGTKLALFIVNALAIVAGIFSLIWIILLANASSYFSGIDARDFPIAGYSRYGIIFVVVVGLLLIFNGILAICGLHKLKPFVSNVCLVLYIVLLFLVIFMLSADISLLGSVYGSRNMDRLHSDLLLYRKDGSDGRKILRQLESNLGCCGANGGLDYLRGKYQGYFKDGWRNISLPDSCNSNNQVRRSYGCIDALQDHLLSKILHFAVTMALTIIIIIINIILGALFRPRIVVHHRVIKSQHIAMTDYDQSFDDKRARKASQVVDYQY